MKKKWLILAPSSIIIVVSSIFIYNNYNYDPYEVPKDVVINLNENKFNVYEEHTSYELVKDINADIISNDVKLENETVGEYKYTLEYIYKKKKYKYDINYKNDDTAIGIDVSKWQGNVNFKAVKDAGVEFVIMRIGSQRSPGEEILMDVKFKEYYKAAKDVGLNVGVYVYNTAISPDDGVKTAKWVMKELNGDKLDFPIAYDFEDWSEFNDFKISLHTLSASYLAFEKELQKNGYDAMLYSSKYYLENVWMHYEKSKIWLAHYTNKTDYKGEYMMWQMTSLAKVDGITENTVDIDILYKNKK